MRTDSRAESPPDIIWLCPGLRAAAAILGDTDRAESSASATPPAPSAADTAPGLPAVGNSLRDAAARDALFNCLEQPALQRYAADSAEAALWQLLVPGQRHDPAGLPAALCRWRGETGQSVEGPLVCADPVNFRADRDAARVTPAAALAIDDAQADALIASLNALFSADGLQFLRGSATTWYLQGMSGAALTCPPTAQVAYRHIDQYPPPLDDGAHWRRLMSEVQMLLHSHEVNSLRAARGLLPVNGLWFWGGGAIEPLRPAASAARIRLFADDAFARGLAGHRGVPCQPLTGDALPADLSSLDTAPLATATRSTGDCLVFVDTGLREALLAAAPEALEEVLDRLAVQRLLPLQRWLDTGQAGSVTIDTGESLVVALAASRKPWWSRLLRAGLRR